MLVIETLLLFLLGLFHLLTGEAAVYLPPPLPWVLDRLSIGYSPPLCAVNWFLAVWAAMVSALFIRTANSAWLHAVSLQGAILAIMIFRYYEAKPVYGYILMVYAAWLVVYLHYSDVAAVFHATARKNEEKTP